MNFSYSSLVSNIGAALDFLVSTGPTGVNSSVKERSGLVRASFETGLVFFFVNDTATTEIYTLSLHDALPISTVSRTTEAYLGTRVGAAVTTAIVKDRKSTRLNSSHGSISYAVFCLKKNK